MRASSKLGVRGVHGRRGGSRGAGLRRTCIYVDLCEYVGGLCRALGLLAGRGVVSGVLYECLTVAGNMSHFSLFW